MEEKQQASAPRSLLPTLMSRLGLPTTQASLEPTALKARLDTLQTQASLEMLLDALNDEDESVRAVAVRALERWHRQVPLKRVLACLDDSSWLVREAVILTLGAWGEEVSLLTSTQEDNEFVREAMTLVQQKFPNTETLIVPLRDSEVKTISALTRVDRLLRAFVIAGSEGRPMDSQGNKQSVVGEREALKETDRRDKRGRVLGVTGGVLAVLVVTGIVFSWLAATQKLPFTTTAHKKSLDAPLLTTTNQMQSPSIHWSSDSSYIIESDPYNLPDATVVNITTKAEGQREVFDSLSASGQQTSGVNSYWTPDGHYLVNSGANAATGQITLEFWNVVANQKVLTISYQDKSILHTGSTYVDPSKRPEPPYVAMASDGTRFAFGKNDGRIEIWDITKGVKLTTLRSDSSTLPTIQWATGSNEILLSQSASGAVQEWDIATGKHFFLLHAPLTQQTQYSYNDAGQVSGQTQITVPVQMMLSPDGKRMAAVTDKKTFQIWDAATGKSLASFSIQSSYVLEYLSWLNDNTHLLLTLVDKDGTPRAVQIANSNTGQPIFATPLITNGLYIPSPSEKYLMVGNQDGKSVTVWDTATGRQVSTYHNATTIDTLFDNNTVLWSPDEQYIAMLSKDKFVKTQNNVVQVWDARTGKIVATYHSHSNQVIDVQWSPNGNYLATVSDADLGNIFEVWQAPN